MTAGGTTGTITCAITGGVNLACTAGVGGFTMPANATFTVTFNVTPSTAGTLANPRVGSVCRIDSSSVVTETDETNNNCADSVTVVNSAPVAVNDSATTAEDTAVAIDAAANDTDVDGTSPTVKPGSISSPAHGTATLITVGPDAGKILYTPALNYNGSDSFTYVATDGSLDSAPATVSITVSAVNDPPVNTVPGAQTTAEDTSLVFSSGNLNQVSVSDVDMVGSSIIQVSLGVTHGTLTLGSIVGLTFTTGANGSSSMVFHGSLTNVNAALAGLAYAPAADFNGGALLTITSDDLGNFGSGGALTDTDTVAITVTAVNDAPVAVNDSATTAEDTAVAIDAAANDTDVDGTSPTVKPGSISSPAHGTATLITVGPDAGKILYTPALNYNGSD